MKALNIGKTVTIQGARPLNILRGIHLELEVGQFVMLRGRSGSGKTTLLNLLSGLDIPTEGEVWLMGKRLDRLSDRHRTLIRRSGIGLIFQTFALMPMLTAQENIELSLRIAGIPEKEWQERTAEALALIGLKDRSGHYPGEMSGGEQQRVAIAKAFVHKPKLMIADEPTADLDTRMAKRMALLFRSLTESAGMTVCMTTHDSVLWEVADRVYHMEDGILSPN